MKKGVNECLIKNKLCQKKSCRYWQPYEEDYNCTFITVDRHGPLSLKEVAAREKISLVRVKQIQDKALVKLKKLNPLMKDFLT